jgi:hypothetical protein
MRRNATLIHHHYADVSFHDYIFLYFVSVSRTMLYSTIIYSTSMLASGPLYRMKQQIKNFFFNSGVHPAENLSSCHMIFVTGPAVF